MKELLIVYAAGAMGITKAVFVATAINVDPVRVCLMTAMGALTSVVVLYVFHGWISRLFESRGSGSRFQKRMKRLGELFSRYGIPGLGIIGTVIMGSNVTILLGLFLIVERRKLLMWTAVGIVVWVPVLTFAVDQGLGLVSRAGLIQRVAQRYQTLFPGGESVQ